MASAKSRATLSVGPPAAKGTTMVTDLVFDWVFLRVGIQRPSIAAHASVTANSFFIEIVLNISGN